MSRCGRGRGRGIRAGEAFPFPASLLPLLLRWVAVTTSTGTGTGDETRGDGGCVEHRTHARRAVGEVKLAAAAVGRAATRGEDDQESLNSLDRLIRRVRRVRRKSTGYGHGRRWPSSWPSSWTQTTLRISTVVNTTAMHPKNPREYLGIGVRLRYI